MRAIPDALGAKLASGVTSLCHVWRFTRRGEAQFAFTDHDRPLTFDALTCEPALGLAAGAIEKSTGLCVDTASIVGALNSEAISEDDLARGLWDGARVDVYRVDWSEPALRMHVFAGRLGEVRRGKSAFEAELRGLQAALLKPVGRVFSRYCDADLGDARCGKDVSGAAYRAEGVVAQVLSSSAFAAEFAGYADSWFARGRLQWDAGGEAEIAAHRQEGDVATIELLEPAGAVLSEGAAFTITAGCDKRFETCRAKFANTANFRGFPHMPGNDAVQSGPASGERLDGSSRFS